MSDNLTIKTHEEYLASFNHLILPYLQECVDHVKGCPECQERVEVILRQLQAATPDDLINLLQERLRS